MLFGALQAVQDNLDNPFDGVGEDDIDILAEAKWPGISMWRWKDPPRHEEVSISRRGVVVELTLAVVPGGDDRTQTLQSRDPSYPWYIQGVKKDLQGAFWPSAPSRSSWLIGETCVC